MASSKTLEQAIADITIWRKGEQRAPQRLKGDGFWELQNDELCSTTGSR